VGQEAAMKWMLFVLVFGSYPVETNLLFDNLDACLKAEQTMRKEYARSYSQSIWTEGNIGQASDPSVVSRDGQKTTATCIRTRREIRRRLRPFLLELAFFQ
jgi:hypothetical protein